MGDGEIKGLCAFRSNIFEGRNIVSPVRHHEWDSQIVWATKCINCTLVDPVIKDDVYSPGMGCSCGIYATLTASEIWDYMYLYDNESVLLLVEAIGHYVVCYDKHDPETFAPAGGFRAEGVQVQAIVNMSSQYKRVFTEPQEYMQYSRKKLLMTLAANKFHVPIIEYDEAIEVAKIMWEQICPDLPWVFNLKMVTTNIKSKEEQNGS